MIIQMEMNEMAEPLPLPDQKNSTENQAVAKNWDFPVGTEIQGATLGVVPLHVQRRQWYDSLRFPENQHDYDPSRKGKEHSIYLVSCGPFVKISVAWDPTRRLGDFTNGAPWDMKLEIAYWLPRAVSTLAEAYCHAALEQFWCCGEWFEIETSLAKRVLRAICLRAGRSRGSFLREVQFAYVAGPDRPARPRSARLLGPIAGYRDPPLFPASQAATPHPC